MREIEFRAWVNHSFSHGYVYFTAESGLYGFTNPILEQYTGLKDKNGVKIFEGDIYNYKKEVGTIEFKMGCFWCVSSDDAFELYSMHMYTEIIGNIHENPELLIDE